jgi:hypothetical protein
MDALKYWRCQNLFYDTHPERNFSYVSDVPDGYRVRLPRDRMYIVFPEEIKEDNITTAINDVFDNLLMLKRYTYGLKVLHNVITTEFESPVDDSENFSKASITLELQGIPKHEIFILAEVLTEYQQYIIKWYPSSVMVIDPNDTGYYIGDFITEYDDDKDEDIDESLNESSINRIVDWLEKFDIACVSATRTFFKNPTKMTLDDRPQEYMDQDALYRYTNKENRDRNSKMKAVLLKNGYGVTSIYGGYIESYKEKNPVERIESSMFVVNLNNDPDFFSKIFELAEFYNQDSFLYKKKDEDIAYLVGTNNSDFPGYGNVVEQGSFHSNISNEFFSKLGNRSFAFVKDLSVKNNNVTNDFNARKIERIEKHLADSLDTYENQSINAKNIITNWSKEVNDVMESLKD